MSIDCRTRRYSEIRALKRDEIFDDVLPGAAAVNGALAARGIASSRAKSLAFTVDGRSVTVGTDGERIVLEQGSENARVEAELASDALSDLVQDVKSAMGLAMESRVTIRGGGIPDWICWEPIFRALFDGRPVHEPGSIDFRDQDGQPLDLSRSFALDDDREEVAHFMREAGFLHVRSVFTPEEMAEVEEDLDGALGEARQDDGASWWATDEEGHEQAVRVMNFHRHSVALQKLLSDDRLQWLARLTGDGHDGSKMGAEGLVKPLRIARGLSDLPWHKDCGQGSHSYFCNSMTVGISVTGAGRANGALGVVPGSHRANIQTARLDPKIDLEPRMIETATGDLTVHCSDTLHMSHQPLERIRKVVYTGFRLAPLPGDTRPEEVSREERAALTNVQDRIEGSAPRS